MDSTIKTKVDDLTGPALIWAAIVAEGHAPHVSGTGIGYRSDHGSWVFPDYRDHEAAELMVKHWIGVERPSKGQTPPLWRALADFHGDRKGGRLELVVSTQHPDFSVAVTRCFVKSKFGDSIDVPQSILDLVS